LYLKDDRHDPWWLPVEIGSGFAEGGIDFGAVDTNDYSYDLKVSALEDGLFSVTRASLLSVFYIEKSVLTINYGEAVSVPEPGAITLLGIGLVGTALAARRRNRQVK